MGRGEWGQRGAGGRQPEEILTWLQEQGWFGEVRAKDGWHVWICDARGLAGKSCSAWRWKISGSFEGLRRKRLKKKKKTTKFRKFELFQ